MQTNDMFHCKLDEENKILFLTAAKKSNSFGGGIRTFNLGK